MPTDEKIFTSVPVGSLLLLPPNDRSTYIAKSLECPKNIGDLLYNARTGAFLRGLVKTYDLPAERGPQLAFLVLKIAIGELPTSQLSTTIAQTPGISGEVAQKIANEIQKELFAPIALELNSYLAKKQAPVAPVAPRPPSAAPPKPPSVTDGLPNVLDLKQKPPL